MQTRRAIRWPALVLAAAVLTIPAFDANANTGNQFGPAVDNACATFNGTQPFTDNSCALCHNSSNLGQRQEPEWTWWQNGDLTNFCPPASNTAPLASNDSAGTNEDVAVSIAVLNNDSDADGDALNVSSVTQGANGSVTSNGGNLRYTPNADFHGSDTFTYTANDGTANSNIATVSVTVNPVNDPPSVANPGNQLSVEGQSLVLQIAADDPDTGDTLRYSASGLPTGLGIAAGSGLISGTPAADSSGNSPYTVRVTADDGVAPTGTSSATFTWTVSATNSPPTITSAPVTTAIAAEPYRYQVLGEDEGPLSYALGSAPSGMTISASGLIQWTPDASRIGANIVLVSATDDAGLSASQAFTVEVQAASAPPGSVACNDADGDGFSPDGGFCGPVDSRDGDPAINPGRAEICDDGIDNDSDGNTDASDSECDGSNCLAGLFGVVSINSAVWDAAATELQVHGSRCNSGSPIVLRNADSGAVVENSVVDNTGAWSFNTPIGDVTAVPCRVRIEVDENSGEIDVANAPTNCDGGGGSVPSITEAEWDADDEHLEVEGDGAERGQAVAVYSATSNGLLGTTRVRRNGTWKFERSDPSPVPCAVRVEIAGRSAERRVADAPDHCGADVDPVAVPGVVGLSQSDAESAIEAAGLRVGSVTEQASAVLAAGIVISQNPVGGTGVESDKAVSLVVSTGRALPAADFSIERASWDADDRKLLVRGTDGPRGQGRATLLSADGRVVLGQTKVEDDGKWKFEVEKPRQAPCRILVEIGSSAAMRAVRDAPANCLQ